MIAVYLLCALVALGLVTVLFRLRRTPDKAGRSPEAGVVETPARRVPDSECCGQHEVCEKESLLAALSRQVEYYDDEELDRFRGRPTDAFSDEEQEEFREVLYTMREDEVAGWVRSLQLRGVPLPDALRDEVFLIIGERRSR